MTIFNYTPTQNPVLNTGNAATANPVMKSYDDLEGTDLDDAVAEKIFGWTPDLSQSTHFTYYLKQGLFVTDTSGVVLRRDTWRPAIDNDQALVLAQEIADWWHQGEGTYLRVQLWSRGQSFDQSKRYDCWIHAYNIAGLIGISGNTTNLAISNLVKKHPNEFASHPNLGVALGRAALKFFANYTPDYSARVLL